jgi:hypothetical protein
MGVDKFALFVELHHPSAILPATRAATSNRSVNNAFVRAGQAGQRIIVDAMTHLHAIGGRMSFKNRAVEQSNKNNSDIMLKNHVTGDEFAEHFFSSLKSYFWQFKPSQPNAAPIAVLIFDKAEFVNPAKWAVQSVRSHQSFQRVGKPYPETARVESGGIRVHPSSPTVESIDIDRLLHSRAVRLSFQRFLMDSLTTRTADIAAAKGWPANARLIVDCEEGVFLWRVHPWTGHLMRCDAHSVTMTEENREWLVDMSSFRNQLGEADLAAVFWTAALLRQSPQTGARVISVDTDHAMLQTYHFWDALRAKTATIVWDNDKTIQLHLAPFVTSLTNLGYQRDTLICVGILSKCDYFEKNWATAQVGHEQLYLGVKNYMLAHKKPDTSLARLECFRELLWHIYAVKLKVAPTKQGLAGAGRVHKKMTLLLSDQELCKPYVQFKLAYAYFTAFRCYQPRDDVLDKAASGQYDAEILISSLQTVGY